MKKIVMILLCSIAFVSVKAQYSFNHTASNPTGAITNTSVDTATYTLSRVYKVITIQPKVTRATGTMTGWAVLDYSANGTDWAIGTDTMTLANAASNFTIWNKSTAARYFRIRTGGATTVTGTTSHKISVIP